MTPQHQPNGARRYASPPMKFDRLDPTKPVTNKQLAEAQNALHDCVHNVEQKVDQLADTVNRDRLAGEKRDSAMGEDIVHIKGVVERLSSGKRVAGMTWWQLALVFLGGLSGFQLAYQWLFPALLNFLVTLHAGIMG
jgi:Ca2+-dependent lipid-binding protein